MLGKLIRYDSKIQLKFLGSLFIVSVLVNLFAALAGCLQAAYPKVIILGMFKTFTLGFSILAIVAMLFGNGIYVVLHFRKNLFRDEGYLMHTLPVTETQLFFSKLITGTICVCLSGIAAYLCACIGTRRWNYIGMFMDLMEESGVQGTKMMVLVLVTFLLLIPVTLCQFYAALTLGYTWKNNSGNHVSRDLLSIASYIILYMIQQVIGLIAILIYLVASFGNPFSTGFVDNMESFMDTMEHNTGGELVSYVQGMVGIALGLNIVVGIVLTIVIIWRLNRHLNLE